MLRFQRSSMKESELIELLIAVCSMNNNFIKSKNNEKNKKYLDYCLRFVIQCNSFDIKNNDFSNSTIDKDGYQIKLDKESLTFEIIGNMNIKFFGKYL